MQTFMVDDNGKAKTLLVKKDVNWGNGSHSIFSNGGTALGYPREERRHEDRSRRKRW